MTASTELHRLRRFRRITVSALAIGGVIGAVWLTAWLLLPDELEEATPREVVQAYVDAARSDNHAEVFDLLCEAEQFTRGPEDTYIAENEKEDERIEGMEVPFDEPRIAGEPVRLHRYPHGEAWRVGVGTEDRMGHHTQYLVVREKGQLRVCGDPTPYLWRP